MTRNVLSCEAAAATPPEEVRVVRGGWSRRWLVGLCCLALAACGDSDEEEGDACAASGLDFTRGDAAAGATVFSAVCASCHGTDGMGLPTAPTAGTRGINLHDEINEPLADDCWVEVVRKGYGDMVPVNGISDQQIVDVLAYMKDTYGK